MNLKCVTFYLILCLKSSCRVTGNDFAGIRERPLTTASQYTSLFENRRIEQHANIKQRLQLPYEKNYKLLTIVYKKIFQILSDSKNILEDNKYSPTQGFPQQSKTLQEAVVHILENCCLAAENVLHFPEISYSLFKILQLNDWKVKFNWCIEFVAAYPHIINEPTVKMIDLFKQEINEDLREPNYKNPFYSRKSKAASSTKPKLKRKTKKGPQLSGNVNHNEL